MTKLVIDPETERILGVGIVGAGAGELIAEGVLAVEMAALASDLEALHPPASDDVGDADGGGRGVLRALDARLPAEEEITPVIHTRHEGAEGDSFGTHTRHEELKELPLIAFRGEVPRS